MNISDFYSHEIKQKQIKIQFLFELKQIKQYDNEFSLGTVITLFPYSLFKQQNIILFIVQVHRPSHFMNFASIEEGGAETGGADREDMFAQINTIIIVKTTKVRFSMPVTHQGSNTYHSVTRALSIGSLVGYMYKCTTYVAHQLCA